LIPIMASFSDSVVLSAFTVNYDPQKWLVVGGFTTDRTNGFSIFRSQSEGKVEFATLYTGPRDGAGHYILPGEGAILVIKAKYLGDGNPDGGMEIASCDMGNIHNEMLLVDILKGFGGGVQSGPSATIYRTVLNAPIPNPTVGGVSIPFSLKSDGYMTLKVYDASGRLVENLYQGREKAGWHTINWACEVPQGVYFVVLKTGHYQGTRRLVKMK